jgi:hypothetical protein
METKNNKKIKNNGKKIMTSGKGQTQQLNDEETQMGGMKRRKKSQSTTRKTPPKNKVRLVPREGTPKNDTTRNGSNKTNLATLMKLRRLCCERQVEWFLL